MLQPTVLTDNLSPESQLGESKAAIAVTVIVPMRNEEQRIGVCLESILANDFDHDQLEILVVDGRSTDRSRTVVEEWAARSGIVRLLDNPARIVSAGLNIGIRSARGSIIIIMGAHTEYSRNYIRTCVEGIENGQADAIGGVLETRSGGPGLVAHCVALMTQHRFGVGGSTFRTRRESGYVDTVPYGAYRREVFERVGLFNEKLTRNQDFELNARLHNAGGRLFLSTQISATYYNVPNFRRLVRQALSNGYWLPQMWLACPPSIRMRHAVPALFVSTLLISSLGTPFYAMASVPGLLAVALYTIAVTIAAGQIVWHHGLKLLLPLVALFFTHHIAYGLGTLAGFLTCAILAFRPSPEASPTASQL